MGKRCARCKIMRPISDFYLHKSGDQRGKPTGYCKHCHAEEVREWTHKTGIRRPLEEATECALYLGTLAEDLLSQEFDNFQRMPTHNKGYDYVCGKGFKIDVKVSTLITREKTKRWIFNIERNINADYFLCLALDNRENKKPVHLWLIPGKLISGNYKFSISDTKRGLGRWASCERSLDRIGGI